MKKNKNRWVSDKISKLIKEEKMPQKQAIAVAMNMYQMAGQFPNFPNIQNIVQSQMQSPQQDFSKPTTIKPQQEDWYTNNPPMFSQDGATTPMLESEYLQTQESSNALSQESTTQTENPNAYKQPIQFANPYGGVDIPTGANFLGQAIGKKDAEGIVWGGLKTLTGVGRNVLAGMGQGKVQEEAMQNYYDNQRENTYTSFQEGGEQVTPEQIAQALQQGMPPEQVVEFLVQSGMTEQEALQMVQQLMGQMQGQEQPMEQEQQPMMKDGGEYMKQMIGKKIKNYNFNPKTNSYDVEFE